jgi:hypothetical protein
MERAGSLTTLENLKKDLDDRKRRQAKLIEALETTGEIVAISSRLKDLESEIRQIESSIKRHGPVKIEDTIGGIRQHVTDAGFRLKESLIDDTGRTWSGRKRRWPHI